MPEGQAGRCVGKAGVVTGVSRGLGREVLLTLCREGASVLGLARDAEAGNHTAGEAAAAGGRARFRQGDVRREEDIVSAIDQCREEFGALDFVVANAGILGEGRLHETTNDAVGRPRRDTPDRRILEPASMRCPRCARTGAAARS